jgi:ubiquinone/menaquinone biosynthesis C-methylase UbiE
MKSKNQDIRRSIHDFDKEYQEGAHWDTDKPSSPALRLLKLVKKDAYILDAGCGAGRDVIFLAKRGFRVSGIDMSPVGVALAKQRSKGLQGIDFHIGKGEDLPYADNTFDAGYTAYVFEGPTFPKVVAEISRVIKPDGYFSVAMFLKTRYKTPCERDSDTPLPFVLESLRPYFEIKEQEVDSYWESDDAGEHNHERLQALLVNKKKNNF